MTGAWAIPQDECEASLRAARAVRDYWAARGVAVDVAVRETRAQTHPASGATPLLVIRSNMKNGLPAPGAPIFSPEDRAAPKRTGGTARMAPETRLRMGERGNVLATMEAVPRAMRGVEIARHAGVTQRAVFYAVKRLSEAGRIENIAPPGKPPLWRVKR